MSGDKMSREQAERAALVAAMLTAAKAIVAAQYKDTPESRDALERVRALLANKRS